MKIIVIAVLLLVAVLYFMFPFVEVVGLSMFPTYNDKDILLSRRVLFKKLHKYKPGEVYVFKAPYEDDDARFIIKRVSFLYSANRSVKLYMLGDNSSNSYDSRYYGAVDCNFVVSKVLIKLGGDKNGRA